MRARVVVVVVLSVLVAGALIASYFLERVEAPKSTYVPPEPMPVAIPFEPKPRTIERVVEVPDAAVAVVEEGTEVKVPREEEYRGVPFLAVQGSAALRALCQQVVDTCAARFPPWYPSTLSTDLELERIATGSRIVRAHTGSSQNNGPPAFNQCVVDGLKDGELADLPIDADQQMVRCLPRSPKNAAFPSAAKFRDDLKRCLSKLPSSEVSVSFEVVNVNGTLKNSDLKFEGLGEIDSYARRCLELALEAKVPVSPNEMPKTLPRVTLSVSDDGKKISNSFSFGAP